jgi:phosphoglycolate phosphatase-like HAD superfamily hydrolase
MHQHLVLFDVDGTLLRTRGVSTAAIRTALLEVFGTVGSLDSYSLGGRCVSEILWDVLQGSGIPTSKIERNQSKVYQVMLESLAEVISRGNHGIEACPGGVALVEEVCRRGDMLSGLLTGNPREYAELKLRSAGYNTHSFVIGAYGDEAKYRVDLVKLARERAWEVDGCAFPGVSTVIIGDTVHDIAGARASGARSLIVVNGAGSRAALEEAGADVVFDDLQDVQAVVMAITTPPSPDLRLESRFESNRCGDLP